MKNPFPHLFGIDAWYMMNNHRGHMRKYFPKLVHKEIGTSDQNRCICLAYEQGKKPSKKQIKKMLKKDGVNIKYWFNAADKLDLYRINCDIEMVVASENKEQARQMAIDNIEFYCKTQLWKESPWKAQSKRKATIVKVKSKDDLLPAWLKSACVEYDNLFYHEDFPDEADFKNIGEFLDYKEQKKKKGG